LSVVLLGVWPGRVLEAQGRAMAPEHMLALTASERRGREIYSREGCAYCHTQQIRFLHADMQRFGAPTLAWETRLDYPHLWGTRRIGPDLAREGGTHTQDWHLAHLFSPRALVPDSIMPGYPSLFDGAADRPRQSARDLVAYLETLGRARELAGPEGAARARQACDCEDDEMLAMALSVSTPLNSSAARPRRSGDAPQVPAAGDLERGRELFVADCAGCHGAAGTGDGPGAAALRPRPAALKQHSYARARVVDALWNGVAGTSMPAWRDYPPADLAAVADFVRSLDATAADDGAAAEQLALGAAVYAANCVQCHGVAGDGRGTAVAELKIAPTDFHAQRPSFAIATEALARGVAGTQMAPWTDRLSEEQRAGVARYVRSLYEGDGARPGAAR
jgi:cytochrome c oxidase cbb3-type subunit 2/cytochrome c oxidase cbb3-type subunit I/II